MTVAWARPSAHARSLLQIYGGLALLALLVARFIPIARWLQPWWGCPLRRLTGIPCMGCGLTRAFDYTAHGRFADAFKVTPLGALAPWLCLALAVAAGASMLLPGASVPRVSLTGREQWAARTLAIGAVLINWAYMVVHRAG